MTRRLLSARRMKKVKGRTYVTENGKYAGSISTEGKTRIPTAQDFASTASPSSSSRPNLIPSLDAAVRDKARLYRAQERVAYLDALTISHQIPPQWIGPLRYEFGWESGSAENDWNKSISLMGVNTTSNVPEVQDEIRRVATDEQERKAIELEQKLESLKQRVLAKAEADNWERRDLPWVPHVEALIRITRGSTAREEIARLSGTPQRPPSPLEALESEKRRVDADTVAAWIREADGSHSLGAGALGEKLAERFNQL